MADTSVAITAGTGTNVDTRTEGTNGNHRQVVVLGDPATNAGVAPVDATAGLKVNLGTDNDVTLAELPDTAAGDLAAITTATEAVQTAVEGTLTVDLGANNDVTVTGTVDLGATDNAVLDTIATNTGAALTDTELRATPVPVDLGANNDVTLAELPDTAAGDLAAINTAVSGTLTVDLGANNDVTVTGTVDLGATDNAVLDSIDTAVNGTLTVDATGQGDIPVTLDGEEVVLGAGSAAIGKLAANSGVDIGDVDVTSISAGSNLIGDVGIQGRASGGLSTYYDSDLDETAVAIKSGAGTVYAIQAFNTTAAPLFLQLFDVAQGSVTVGTTTPDQQYVIPGNADSDGAGFTFNVPQGKAFGTAITAACSTDSEGNSAPGAGACIINIDYK